MESSLPALRRTMLEVLYVARNMGFDETVLPARVIDSLLKVGGQQRRTYDLGLKHVYAADHQDLGD